MDYNLSKILQMYFSFSSESLQCLVNLLADSKRQKENNRERARVLRKFLNNWTLSSRRTVPWVSLQNTRGLHIHRTFAETESLGM